MRRRGTARESSTALDEILERNRAYVPGRAAKPLPPPEAIGLLVITCYDPRLDEMLRPALGLDRGRAFLFRSAGAVVAPAGDPLRSVALAAYLFDLKEVVVVGHTSCRMATFETARFIEAFRSRGVTREAFGPEDLRAWVGAIADPRRGVLASVATLRAAPALPRDLAVSGAVLDDATGELEVVARPGEALPGERVARPAPVPPVPEPAPPPAPARPRSGRGDAPAGPPPPGERADLAAAMDAARAFVKTLAAKGDWRERVQGLGADLRRQPNALAQLGLVDHFVRRAARDSREVAGAFERLRREAGSAGSRLSEEGLLDVLRRIVLEDRP